MRKDFVKITCSEYGSEYYLHVDNLIFSESGVVFIPAVHGEGNGVIHITRETVQYLKKVVEDRVITDSDLENN